MYGGRLPGYAGRVPMGADGLREKSTSVERKVLVVQEVLVEELRAFLNEVKHVALLWRPNLDDGVIINFASLWRLVP